MAAFLTAIGAAIGLSGTAATVAGAALVGTAAYGASKLIGGKQEGGSKESAAPAIQPLPKAPSLASAEKDAQKDIENKRRAIARNKSIYTDPVGLSPSEKSGIALKTLTGT